MTSQIDPAALYGNRFITQEVPSKEFPGRRHDGVDAMRLVAEDPRSRATRPATPRTFVTTWMEPEAQRLIAGQPAPQLHRPRRVPAHGRDRAALHPDARRPLPRPRPDDRSPHPGLVRGDHARRPVAEVEVARAPEAAGRPTDRPNLVFGGDVHVVWEKFCRYFDVEPRIVPLRPDKYTIGPGTSSPTWTRTRSASPPCSARRSAATATTSSGSTTCCCGSATSATWTSRSTSTAPVAACLAVPLPGLAWDFRLEQVRSINVSGHKFGLVYPGIGWLVFRSRDDLAEPLVFKENYLGKTDETFTLNFSTGSSMVIAQYYNFVRFGRSGYSYIMKNMQANAEQLADLIQDVGRFWRSSAAARSSSPGGLQARRSRGVRRVRRGLAALGRARLDGAGHTMPPDAQEVTIMRALVKETMSREHVDTLARDIHDACDTLTAKGGAHDSERAKMVTGQGHGTSGVAPGRRSRPPGPRRRVPGGPRRPRRRRPGRR